MSLHISCFPMLQLKHLFVWPGLLVFQGQIFLLLLQVSNKTSFSKAVFILAHSLWNCMRKTRWLACHIASVISNKESWMLLLSLLSPFLFALRCQQIEYCNPWLGWVSLTKWTNSRNSLLSTPSSLFPRWY